MDCEKEECNGCDENFVVEVWVVNDLHKDFEDIFLEIKIEKSQGNPVYEYKQTVSIAKDCSKDVLHHIVWPVKEAKGKYILKARTGR